MATQAAHNQSQVRYGYEPVDGVNVFYRESGTPKQRAVVLLHSYPASSHMYREVLAALGDDYYVIAPDYPGFGNSDFPSSEDYEYTFENLTNTIEKFLEQTEDKAMIPTLKRLSAANARNDASDTEMICNHEDNYYGDKVCVPASSQSTRSKRPQPWKHSQNHS